MGNKAANPAQESSLVNNTRNAHELKPAEVSKQEEQPSGGRNGHDKQPTGADGDVPARTPGDPRISSIIDGQAIRKDVGASRRIILEPLGGVGPRSPAGVAAPMTSQAKDPFKIRSQYLIQSREEIIVDVLSLLTAVTDEVAERVASTPSFAVEMPSNTPADGLESSAPPQVDFGLAGKGPVVGAVADASGAVHVEESEISADVVETVDSLIMALESMDDSGAVEASATESLIAVSAFEAAITDVVQVDPVDEIISTLESDVAPIDASEAATDEPATADEPAAVEDVIGVGGRDALQVSQPAAEVEADGDNSSDLVHAPTELSSEQLEAADAHLDTVPGEGATDVTMAPTVPVVPPDVTVVTIVPLEASTAAVIEAPALILTVDPSRTKLLAGSSLKRTVGVWKEYEENATGHRFYINQESDETLWDKPADVVTVDEDNIKRRLSNAASVASKNEDDDEERAPWVPPSLAVAAEYRRSQLYGGGTSSIKDTAATDFVHFGMGVTLYFQLLKSLAIIMACASIIFIPLFIVYHSGHRIPVSTPDPMGIARLMLGNVGRSTDANSPMYPFASFLGATMSGEATSVLVTVIDMFFSFTFFVFTLAISRRVRQSIEFDQRKIVSPADYTAFVKNLPKDATEAEVRRHFDSLFRLDMDVPKPARIPFCRRLHSCCLRVCCRTAVQRRTSNGSLLSVTPPPPPKVQSSAKAYTSAVPLVSRRGVEAGDDADAIATGSVPAEPGNIPVPASESAPKFSPILEMKGGAGEAMQQRRSPYTNSVDELADELHIPDPPATSRHESQQSDTLESAERLLADLNKDNWPLPPTTADTTDVVREGKPQPQSVVCIRVDTNLSAHITPAPTTSKLQSSGQVVDVQSYENLKGYGHSVKAMLGPTLLKTRRRFASSYNRASGQNTPVPSVLPRPGPVIQAVEEMEDTIITDAQPDTDQLTLVESKFFTVHDVSHNGKEDYLGSWVADVRLTHPFGNAIRHILEVADVTEKLRSARARVSMFDYDTVHPKGPNEKLRKKALEKARELQVKIDDIKRKHHFTQTELSDVCGAFVTFNNEESFQRCLAAYKQHQGIIAKDWNPMPKSLKFKEKKKIQVFPAADPSDILWENLDAPHAKVELRRCGTLFASALVVILSFLIVLIAKSAHNTFAARIPDFTKCGVELPALIMKGYDKVSIATSEVNADSALASEGFTNSVILQRSPVGTARTAEDAQCSSENGYYVAYRGISSTYLSYSAGACASSSIPSSSPLYSFIQNDDFSLSCPDPIRAQQCPCADPTARGTCMTLSCFPGYSSYARPPYNKPCVSFPVSTVIGCYCLDKFQSLVRKSGLSTALHTVLHEEKDVCGPWAENYALAQSLLVLSAVIASLANTVSGITITALIKAERYTSISNHSWAATSKTLAAKFINIGVLVLMVYGTLPNHVALPVEKFDVLNGAYDDMNSDWYGAAGVYIGTLVLSNTIVPLLLMVLDWFLRGVKRTLAVYDLKTYVLQEQLNDVYVGPRFELEDRYTEILVDVLVTMMYGTGIPILFVFTAFGLTARYWIEKALLLRYYRKPPRYGPQLANLALSVLPWALLLHLAFSVWMVSSPGLLPSNVLNSKQTAEEYYDSWNGAQNGDSIGIWPRIIRLNAFPLFVFTLFVAGSILVHSFGGKLSSKLFQSESALEQVLSFVSDFTVSVRARKWTSPFTSEFGRILNVNEILKKKVSVQEDTEFLVDGVLDGDPTAQHGTDASPSNADPASASALPPQPLNTQVSGAASLVPNPSPHAVHTSAGVDLSVIEVQQGWRVETLPGPVSVLRKLWTTSVKSSDPVLSHSVGEPKRTWQVVADAGLYDYDILNNANYKDVIEELARKLSSPKAKDDSKRLGAVTCFGALKRRGGKVAPLSNDIEPADKRVEVIVVQPDAGDAKHATDVEAVPRGDADEVSPASGLAKRDSVQGSNKQRLVSPSQTTQAAFEQSQRVDPPGIVPQTNVEYKM